LAQRPTRTDDRADESARVRLSLATLDRVPPQVARPRYRREQLTPGIVQFGVSELHQAQLAVYLDRLMNAGLAHDWAIVGAGAVYVEREVRSRLAPQDWLYTVVEQSATRSTARVIGVMPEFLPVTDPDLYGFSTIADPAAAVARMTDPAIRIVSMSGPSFFIGGTPLSQHNIADEDHWRWSNVDHPMIRNEVATGQPETEVGMIVAALQARRQAGFAPFAVLANDDVPDNGQLARAVVAGRAELSDPRLADWIREEVAFPSSMIDRFVVRPNGDRIARFRDEFGYQDAWPVFCEDYAHWVIEDDFPSGRPTFEAAGATVVDDVAPFKVVTSRILDGGQAAVAFAAALMGIQFVHEAMGDPLIAAFLEKVATEEIIPTVPQVPGTDLKAYLALAARRLANPGLDLTVRQVAYRGSSRQQDLIVPSLVERLARGLSVEGLSLVSALCCRYCYVDSDDLCDAVERTSNFALISAAKAARSDPGAWLGLREVYGSVAEAPAFRERFVAHLAALWRDGTNATLARYLCGRA
jgi:mannitol 2-dehydrogenase